MSTRRSLRIVHVCPYFYPVQGGLERVILELSEAMVDRGHRVTVFSSNLSRNGRIETSREMVRGIEVLRFPNWFRLGPFAALWPQFCFELRARQFDVIHAHSYRHPHCDLAALRQVKGQAKFVLQPHWPGHPRSLVGTVLANAYDGVLGGRLLRACDLVLALTPAEVPWLRAHGAKDVRVLPNGIPARILGGLNGGDFRGRYHIDGFFALSVGRIDEMKGFQFVIKALRLVDDMRYVIVGPAGDFSRQLADLIRQEGLEDRVVLTGALSEPDVLNALDACDVYIQPSLFESFGLSALEALARGKACMGSQVGGLASVLGGAGLLFEAGSVEDIARGLRRLRQDHELRRALGATGRVKASDFTWERIVPQYESLLLELTGRDPAADGVPTRSGRGG
jgi:glycosyltransferase involved in cell wall biosynthesis